MKKIITLIFFILTALTFSKDVEINFHFDIDSGFIYYSNAGIDSIGNLNTIQFDKKDVKITLRDGTYIFGFYDNKDRYLFRKLYITNDRDFDIFFVPRKSIFVEGNISEKNIPLKNVKLLFVDSAGREYPVFSDENGKYSVNLPPEKYTLISSQFGYEVGNKDINFNFSEPDESYTIPVKFIKAPGKIKGKVLSDKNTPVQKAKIFISNNKKEKIIYTDINGNFSTSLEEGITSMKISKEGFSPTGFIDRFTREDTTKIHKFNLNKKTYFISGTVINDVLPIKNQEIYLFLINGALLDKTITNENGNFKFLNIDKERVYIYIPESENYEEYKSELMTLEESKENNIITLERK